MKQLSWFLSDVPGTACPKAGKAAYSEAVRTSSNMSAVTANNFFAFHTVLKTSEDYYEAMRWARRLSDNISMTINGNISGIHYSQFFKKIQTTLSILKADIFYGTVYTRLPQYEIQY